MTITAEQVKQAVENQKEPPKKKVVPETAKSEASIQKAEVVASSETEQAKVSSEAIAPSSSTESPSQSSTTETPVPTSPVVSASETPKDKGALVPVTIRNVNLTVNFRLPPGTSETALAGMTDTLARMRATFGEHVLIEELTQLVHGTVETISIEGVDKQHRQPEPQQVPPTRSGQPPMVPVQVQVPVAPQPQAQAPQQQVNSAGAYVIMSDCPWKGQSLQVLNPLDVYRILTTPEKVAVLHPQDAQMMNQYYTEWYQAQQAKPPGAVQMGIPAVDDQIPFI